MQYILINHLKPCAANVSVCLGPGAKKGQLDVTFFVKEKGRLHLGVSAHAGTQSGDAVSKTT